MAHRPPGPPPRRGSASPGATATCGSSGVHAMPTSSLERRIPRARAPLRPRRRRAVADEMVRCRCRTRAPCPLAPSSRMHQSWPGAAFATALPAVHPLPCGRCTCPGEAAAPRAQVVLLPRRTRRSCRGPRRRSTPRPVDQPAKRRRRFVAGSPFSAGSARPAASRSRSSRPTGPMDAAGAPPRAPRARGASRPEHRDAPEPRLVDAAR